MSRAIATLERAVIAANHDCPQIAAAFRKFASNESALVAEVAGLRARLTADENEEYLERHAADADRLDSTYTRAITACPGDHEVQTSIDLAHLRPGAPEP